jgi:arginine decarboxylase
VLAHMTNPEGLDRLQRLQGRGFIETAMLAQKMGLYTIIVVDRFEELETVLEVSKRFDLRPHIGVRAKLASAGWQVAGVRRREVASSASPPRARAGRRAAARESACSTAWSCCTSTSAARSPRSARSRTPSRRRRASTPSCTTLGAGLKFLDVGGGLAVDYDGSQTNFHSSANYSLQEYANDVVFAVQQACDEKGARTRTSSASRAAR